MDEIINIRPNEVHEKIPSRVVVGMSSCQLTLVQSWLEHFLTPLAKQFGLFEYTKDTSSILNNIDKLNQTIDKKHWDLSSMTLFSIDVKALYPSVKFNHLKKALVSTFQNWTEWSIGIIPILTKLIMYTLENQQITWNNEYYLLNQGIPTGGKHSVPLANILLSFMMRDLLDNDQVFNKIFHNNLKLWNRFVDDCVGVFMGSQKIFKKFFGKLKKQFRKYDLEITDESSKESIIVLDIEIYKYKNHLVTKEHRKETSSCSYLKYGSAHPQHIYKGIVKSQMFRLRRLCSRDYDFNIAIKGLRERCLNSGYDVVMVDEILNTSSSLTRTISNHKRNILGTSEEIRWITLSNSHYDQDISDFTRRMNNKLRPHNITLVNVKTTGPSLSKLVFHNNERFLVNHKCGTNCAICVDNRRGDEKKVTSTSRNVTYKIDSNISCVDSGIYAITCECASQYTGKTTVKFTGRFPEHFLKNKGSSIFEHTQQCTQGRSVTGYTIQFLENVCNRGKFSLSEREYLWNHRLKGSLNIQKTLRS